MSQQVEIKIGKRSYRLQSEDGQEARITNVAKLWNNYVSKLMADAPSMDRDNLVVLAGMMMADDFMTNKQEKETNERATESFHDSLAERLEKMASGK